MPVYRLSKEIIFPNPDLAEGWIASCRRRFKV